jgi:hypothetical protein
MAIFQDPRTSDWSATYLQLFQHLGSVLQVHVNPDLQPIFHFGVEEKAFTSICLGLSAFGISSGRGAERWVHP